ncbi:MAG: hypothetical protein COA38_13870 [Fluviicola sp.]|nr:MAG: hypothetical protein COA38_13870 [Fluviicola sp.]
MKKFILYLVVFAFGTFNINAQSTNYPSDTWKKITVNCKVGFVDPEGKIMIEPQYENAGQFSDGVAFVWSYPGKEEDKATVPLGEDYVSHERFNLKGNRRTGIIDSTGKYIMEPKINFNGAAFREGVSLVRIDKGVQIVDRTGKIVTAESQIMKGNKRSVLLMARYDAKLPVKWCFINPMKELIMGPFDKCELFYENLAAVRLGKQYGYVNRNGDMVIYPKFITATSFNEGHATVSVDKGEEANYPQSYGVIDTSGTFIIPPSYSWLGKLSEGRIAYKMYKNGSVVYGFLNLKGEIVIEAQYTEAFEFHDGLASFRIDDKEGYIDINGKIVIQPNYSIAGTFRYGTAYVSIGKNKKALINTEGEIIWGPEKDKNCW